MPTKSTNTDLLFFAGKGGVGKTTCAAARAIVEARRGRRVLVLSTDPAHSLGDALALHLTSTPTRVHGIPRLDAFELDARRAFSRWLRQNRQALSEALEHGTWLDREDITALLDLSLPGVDELVALIEIGRLARPEPGSTTRYDLVVVDTAPTGHTLRLLSAPDTVAVLAGVLDDLQQEHRMIRARFGRTARPEAADRLIEALAGQARQVGELLRNASRTATHLVTLAEDVAVAENEDAVAALRRARIRVADVIVNRLTPAGPPCPICDPRRAAETKAVARVRRSAGALVRLVAARPAEPRGIRALADLGAELVSPNNRSIHHLSQSAGQRATRTRPTARAAATAANAQTQRLQTERLVPPDENAAFIGARLLLFGGKGGVGKTTCAAAVALRLASAAHERRVLLLSVDPAHSLADVLAAHVGDAPRSIPGAPPNLHVREMDARRALAAYRKDVESALAEVTETVGVAGASTSHVGDLLELAPPGIDELLGIVSVVESLGLGDEGDAPPSAAYDLVVCDTAPTGHALRLLETPDAAREWVQALLRMLLKYRDVVRPGRLAEQLVALSKSIRRLHELLRNPEASRFIAVTRAADLPQLETERLVLRLRKLSVSVPAVVINAATTPNGACPWCDAISRNEQRIVRTFADRLRARRTQWAIIVTPLVAPPPIGVDGLSQWSALWRTRAARAVPRARPNRRAAQVASRRRATRRS